MSTQPPALHPVCAHPERLLLMAGAVLDYDVYFTPDPVFEGVACKVVAYRAPRLGGDAHDAITTRRNSVTYSR